MKTFTDRNASWNLAIALHAQGRYAEALERMRTVEAVMPNDAVVLAGTGVVYRDSGDLNNAEEYLRRACAVRPGDAAAHFNLALTLLRAGKLREGFLEYEWRWRVAQFGEQQRTFSQPLWRGEPLEGRRILIYAEQGVGDAIQFVRYAPLVRGAGGDVILEVLPPLGQLMSWMEGEYPIVNALSEGVAFEVQCPLMSLPQRFGTELESIPDQARFVVPAAAQAKWKGRPRKERIVVGVVWAGNSNNPSDAMRSMPASSLLPLTTTPGIEVVSLQVGAAAADTPAGIVSIADDLIDFAETAAAISGLDLVITVDTAAAHLAGSLGRRVWLLVAYASDWRWMLEREDSPWYPSMRIFRQTRPGDWKGVIERVLAELQAGSWLR